jgi:hypothetical protein
MFTDTAAVANHTDTRRRPPALPVHRSGDDERNTYFNHYSLLATIKELFGLEKIGYAEPAITGFDESIFNAGG